MTSVDDADLTLAFQHSEQLQELTGCTAQEAANALEAHNYKLAPAMDFMLEVMHERHQARSAPGQTPAGPSQPTEPLPSGVKDLLGLDPAMGEARARASLDYWSGDVRAAKRACLEASGVYEAVGLIEIRATGDASDEGCPICGETWRECETPVIELRAYRHRTCKSCLQGWANSELRDLGKRELNCPQCPRKVQQAELKQLLDDDEFFSSLQRRVLEDAVAVDPTLYACRTADCKFIASWTEADGAPPRLACPLCKKASCLVCGQQWHDGQSCEEFARSSDVAEAERQLREYMEASGVRRCAQCGAGVVKVEKTCNKMMCRCGYKFCYKCGAKDCKKPSGANCGCTPANHVYTDNVTGDIAY